MINRASLRGGFRRSNPPESVLGNLISSSIHPRRLLRRATLLHTHILLAMTTSIVLCLFTFVSSAQSWMRPPIDSPLYLSGNLCALRGGHFHYGIDLPTNNAEGWPIRAVADGYVSRVNISPYGYGNALFITHYNGYVTVYAHLSKYEKTIYNYILAQHYKRQSFSLDVFPAKNLLKVKKGDIIAYSGNSGGSTGPHLHFEVRDGANMLVNPQMFLDIPDTAKPVVQNIYTVIYGGERQLIDMHKKIVVHDGKTYVIHKIEAGDFYLEAEIFDRQFFYENKLSPREVKLFQNGKLKYHSTFSSFGFHHDKYINRHVDNTFLWDSGKYLQKLYIDKNNFAPFYDRSLGNGKMHIKASEEQYIQIEVADAKGNNQRAYIKLVGLMVMPREDKQYISNVFPDSSTELHNTNNDVVLKIDEGSVDFPTALAIDYSYKKKYPNSKLSPSDIFRSRIIISEKNKSFVSFLKPASINLPIPERFNNYALSKTILYEVGDTDRYPIQTIISKNKVSGIIYHTGIYGLTLDDESPEIVFSESKDGQLVYKISDDLSGISSYRMTINGKWVLAKYDVKAGKLIYDKDNYLPKAAKYIISVSVCDNKGNCNSVTNTIAEF